MIKRFLLLLLSIGYVVWLCNAQSRREMPAQGIKEEKTPEALPLKANLLEAKQKKIEEAKQKELEEKQQQERPVETVEPGGDSVVAVSQATMYSGISDEDLELEQRKKDAIHLVNRGIEYLKNNSLQDACNKFSHTKEFVYGDLYLFVYDAKGNMMAHGQDSKLLWQNVYNLRDAFGSYFVQSIIKTALAGGGWVTYEWRNTIKVSYAQEVKKDNKSYIVGCGYYPHSKKHAAVGLVKAAVSAFNQGIELGQKKEELFSDFSYPLGLFLFGDLYLYALDFNGRIVAQGDRPGLIGTNSLNYKDAKGKKVNQEIINKLKEAKFNEGVWVDYVSKNTVKYTYAEKIKDEQDNLYFIACGYYPEAGRDAAVELVKRGYQLVKRQGISRSADEFTDKRYNDYRFGDLYLFMYDMQGKCIAHGGNAEFVGANHFQRADEDGRLYVQEFIKKAEEGGGWVDVKSHNSFETVYVEPIAVGVEKYLIGCGVYPISKKETVELLVKSGASYFKTHDLPNVFSEFSRVSGGKFIRGDLNLFVFDKKGICYVFGDDNKRIWSNMLSIKDDNGVPYIQEIINRIPHGSLSVEFMINGLPKVAYVEKVEKDNYEFIIGSSYFKTDSENNNGIKKEISLVPEPLGEGVRDPNEEMQQGDINQEIGLNSNE